MENYFWNEKIERYVVKKYISTMELQDKLSCEKQYPSYFSQRFGSLESQSKTK